MWGTLGDIALDLIRSPAVISSVAISLFGVAGVGLWAIRSRRRSPDSRPQEQRASMTRSETALPNPETSHDIAHLASPHMQSAQPSPSEASALPRASANAPVSYPSFFPSDTPSTSSWEVEDDLAGDIAAVRLAAAAPVWQRMDILMASCHAGAAPVLESEPPIWRHPLIVGEAHPALVPVHGDMELQSEDDETVIVSHAPIWRAEVIRERVALALAKETATQPDSVSAAPVWASWIAGARAVSRSGPPGSIGEVEADIQTPPPIWSSQYKWK